MSSEDGREDEVYAAHAASIEVPEMWSAIEERIQRDARRRRTRERWTALAAAAALVLAVLGLLVTRDHSRPQSVPVATRVHRTPAAEAAVRYRVAIARIEGGVRERAPGDPRAATAVAALPELSRAIAAAESAVATSPSDPVAVTRLVAAYDAKLEILRGAAHVQ